MPSDTNRRFHLAVRPTDLPSDAHFRIETAPIPTPGTGEVLVRVLIAALSPWQGQRLKDFENYTKPFEIGELIDCDVLGQVVGGDALLSGDLVTGRLGWQEYAIAGRRTCCRRRGIRRDLVADGAQLAGPDRVLCDGDVRPPDAG